MHKHFLLIAVVFLLWNGAVAQSKAVGTGYQKYYYPNGSLLSEGKLEKGKPEGYWKSYYSTGVLKSEGNRRNFLLDSIWIFYNATGDTTLKINYLLGKRNGFAYEYYVDKSSPGITGRILSKQLYVNNSREGISFYYYPNGVLKQEIPFVNDKEEGKGYEYDETGCVITILQYRNGDISEREMVNRYDANKERTGRWLEWYNMERIKTEAIYREGKLHGYYKEYAPDGNITLTLLYDEGRLVNELRDTTDIKEEFSQSTENGNTIKGIYKNGLPIGIHRTLTPQGKVVDATMYDEEGIKISNGIITESGSREGSWELYYKSGKLRETGNYSANQKEGKWLFYYEDGKVEQLGSYSNGKANGEWIRYYKDGKVFVNENFYGGKEDGEYLELSEDGNILTKGSYLEGEREGEWMVHINDVETVGSYLSGMKNGRWRQFYEDGTLMYEGNFIQGSPEGKHKFYYPNGILKEEQYISNGLPDKHWKKYNELGELILTVTYQKGQEVRINGEKLDLPEGNKVLTN